jgi:integrase
LRWDLKQVFDMAVAEGHITRNPALLLFTPKEAKKSQREIMTAAEVQTCFRALGPRERLIAKLAILAGIRPGEIFALTWGEMTSTYANIRQRVYRGVIDSPKTEQSFRKAALSEGLLREIEDWRKLAPSTAANAWVFPSERMTPLAKENVWRRSIGPKLKEAGLDWVNFQVMRRTHASLMNDLGIEGKLVADQLGHSLDVNQNVYTQSAVSKRQVAVNRLEFSLNGVQTEFTVSEDAVIN